MASTTYYWDEIDDNVCCEEDENGEITASYTHEAGLYGEVIAQKRGDEVRYYGFDGEGNTSELTDDEQNVTDTFEYSAFGEEVARTGTTENPFGYKGAWGYYTNPETGSYDCRVRMYEPRAGRWISPDPARFIDGPNVYVFVLNNPSNLNDPSGLKCVVCKWHAWFSGGILDSDAPIEGNPHTSAAALGWFDRIAEHNRGVNPNEFPLSYGPFTMKQNQRTYVAAAIFAIDADICETHAGDCQVTVTEESTGYVWKNGRWTVDPGFNQVVEIPGTNMNPRGGPGANIAIARIINPPTKCKDRLVFVDAPWFPVDVGNKEWKKRVVKQAITIHEGPYWDENSGATFKHEFEQILSENLVATFKSVNQTQTLFGNPQDCC